jgi:hypothetical protein
MQRRNSTVLLAGIAASLIGLLAIFGTILLTGKSSSTSRVESVTTSTVPPLESAKSSFMEVTSSLTRDPLEQKVSSIVLIDGVPTAATAPTFNGQWEGNLPARIWEYRDGHWAKVFELSGGRPVGDFRFLDVTGDGNSDVLFDGITSLSTETFIATKTSGTWTFIRYLPSNELTNGKIEIDPSGRITTDASVCDGPGCGGELKNYWSYDSTTNSFMRD